MQSRLTPPPVSTVTKICDSEGFLSTEELRRRKSNDFKPSYSYTPSSKGQEAVISKPSTICESEVQVSVTQIYVVIVVCTWDIKVNNNILVTLGVNMIDYSAKAYVNFYFCVDH